MAIYGIGAINFSYLFSTVAKSPAGGFAMVTAIHIITGSYFSILVQWWFDWGVGRFSISRCLRIRVYIYICISICLCFYLFPFPCGLMRLCKFQFERSLPSGSEGMAKKVFFEVRERFFANISGTSQPISIKSSAMS